MPHASATAHGLQETTRVAMFALIALVLCAVVAAIATETVNRSDTPSDAELTENLLTHEIQFNELVAMLNSDCKGVSP